MHNVSGREGDFHPISLLIVYFGLNTSAQWIRQRKPECRVEDTDSY